MLFNAHRCVARGVGTKRFLSADQVETCYICVEFVLLLHDLYLCFFFLLISQRSAREPPCLRTETHLSKSRSFSGFSFIYYSYLLIIKYL
jgi:hypothetical protein